MPPSKWKGLEDMEDLEDMQDMEELEDLEDTINKKPPTMSEASC